jgi:hypothetical protein
MDGAALPRPALLTVAAGLRLFATSRNAYRSKLGAAGLEAGL